MKESGGYKIVKVFVSSMEQLLSMLQKKQAAYEENKQILCTKIKAKGIDTEGFSPERVKWFEMIQNFEQKFQMRIESSFKIISKIYDKTKEKNLLLERNIF